MRRALLYVAAILVALAVLVPVLGGFRDTGQIAANPVGLPAPWVWGNYGEVLGSGTFWRQVWNSTLIALLTVPLAALAAFGLPMTIIILRPFFHSFPNELQDAAAIDGCGPFRFFWRILLPLSRPVLATVSVLAIVGSWNAFLLPLVVLTESDNWTLPLGVTNYSTQYTADVAKILAFTTLSMVPALIFYAFAERHLIAGLTSGAVKG
jgi:raffinose/stachyose/melibiose transport system permease protein